MDKYQKELLERMQHQQLRAAGLSEEEISSGSLSIFEHLKDPTEKVDVISILRLLDILPVMEQEMLDLLISKLTVQGLFRQSLKARLKKISTLLDYVNSEVWKHCNKSGDKSKKSQESWYMNMYDFSTKFTNALVHYIHNIELISNASKSMDDHRRADEIIEQATLLSKLKPGDVFIFLDNTMFCEYTFKEMIWDEEKEEYSIYFCKVANPGVLHTQEVPFYDNRLWRPVIVTSLLSPESLEKLKKEAQEKYQN